ncbi:MAG TPA: GNAT family N-acetyltransferase [Ktedonobacterales bacterium]|nr:GNAT family N-acetyltransferase [Ktedonobacterales bacterium]
MIYPRLPPGYTVRPPTGEDIPAVLGLIRDFDIAEGGEPDPWTPASVLGWWADLDIATDAWLILAPDGQLAGYATVTDDDGGRLFADGYVHPTRQGQGIGSTVIDLTEARAAAMLTTQPDGARVVLVNNVMANSNASCHLLEARGYDLARVFFRMEITLQEPPPAAEWPEGILVRISDGSPEDVHCAYATIEEGFKDHWGHVARSFEDWQKHMFNEPVDPALWFFVQEGDQVAGAALCRVRDDGSGWVNQLAVLRPWRKRGLGLALLHHLFAAFYQRDIRKIGLGVDGQSLTGAQRLYERAGMHVASRFARYEKELRAGQDLLEHP